MSYHYTTRRRFATAVGVGGLMLSGTGVVTARGRDHNFRAHLSGEEEVPPVETDATGQSVFQLNTAGDALSFKLIVANIENVTQAHIHQGAAGVNGPVVAWLYPEGPPAALIPGRFDGVLAASTITGDDLVGPLEDESFDDLIDLIHSGEAYVNVHTSQHPPGEIRGQIH